VTDNINSGFGRARLWAKGGLASPSRVPTRPAIHRRSRFNSRQITNGQFSLLWHNGPSDRQAFREATAHALPGKRRSRRNEKPGSDCQAAGWRQQTTKRCAPSGNLRSSSSRQLKPYVVQSPTRTVNAVNSRVNRWYLTRDFSRDTWRWVWIIIFTEEYIALRWKVGGQEDRNRTCFTTGHSLTEASFKGEAHQWHNKTLALSNVREPPRGSWPTQKQIARRKVASIWTPHCRFITNHRTLPNTVEAYNVFLIISCGLQFLFLYLIKRTRWRSVFP